jgi:glycolate oxidase iron-sulfur subunit
VVYLDPCHLRHGQGIVDEPRALITAAGGRILEIEESEFCCGSAGSYNVARPAMADRLGRRKAARIAEQGVSLVITANPGCTIQMEGHLDPARFSVVSLSRFLADRLEP